MVVVVNIVRLKVAPETVVPPDYRHMVKRFMELVPSAGTASRHSLVVGLLVGSSGSCGPRWFS